MPRVRTLVALGIAMAVVALGTAGYINHRHLPPEQTFAAFAAFVVLLVPFLGFGIPDLAATFRGAASRGWGGAIAVLTLIAGPPALLLIWNRGVAGLLPAAAVVLYVAIPSAIVATGPRGEERASLRDAAAVLAAWLPVELGGFEGLWAAGEVNPSYVIGKTLSVSSLLAALLAIRGLPGMGYRWRLRLEDIGAAAIATTAFLVLAVPAALATGFVVFDPHRVSVGEFAFRFLAIGLMIALPEEILFRGAIFNLLQRATRGRRGPIPALLLSAVIFGLSHLNNFPPMDWRYVTLATYAGICYGWCYLRTGNLMGGILTHAAVDVIHRVFLVTPHPPS